MAARCRWCDRFLDPADLPGGRGLCLACRKLLERALAADRRPVPNAGRRPGKRKRRP